MPPAPVITGFFGKLPARGDFLRSGLPGSFVAAWDGWLCAVLAESRARMGESWLPAWLEAPVWRFVLPAGQCGPDAVLGLWLPSVDAAGRYFPLTLAAVFPGQPALRGEDWLAGAEAAGRLALEHDGEPAALAAQLEQLGPPMGAPAAGAAIWWTEGAPRVAAATLELASLPSGDHFTAMMGGTSP